MKMRMAASVALTALATICGVPAAQAQVTVNLAPGDFTYQFADPVTGAPTTALAINGVGQTAKVAVYLVQTGGTPVNLLSVLGAVGLVVRLNYPAAASGGVASVPSTSAANIIARPPTPAKWVCSCRITPSCNDTAPARPPTRALRSLSPKAFQALCTRCRSRAIPGRTRWPSPTAC